ncbi:MAG: 50S ribosomal protein L21, partial [Candidatus Omnitrophota bacterium]
IVETGGKQYRVKKNDIFEVEKLETEPGKTIKLDKVLMYADGKKVEIGQPYLKNVKVSCEVVANIKAKKVISYKYRRRKSSRTKIGHRQKLTKLKVMDIETK